jgi:hypothetical protein
LELWFKYAYYYQYFLIPYTLGARVDGKVKILLAKYAKVFKLCPQDHRFLLIIQFGSWRLFESFISNSVPIQTDFDYLNMDWPEMIIFGEHYISVKGFS